MYQYIYFWSWYCMIKLCCITFFTSRKMYVKPKQQFSKSEPVIRSQRLGEISFEKYFIVNLEKKAWRAWNQILKCSPSKKEDFNFFYITFLSIMSGKLQFEAPPSLYNKKYQVFKLHDFHYLSSQIHYVSADLLLSLMLNTF